MFEVSPKVLPALLASSGATIGMILHVFKGSQNNILGGDNLVELQGNGHSANGWLRKLYRKYYMPAAYLPVLSCTCPNTITTLVRRPVLSKYTAFRAL